MNSKKLFTLLRIFAIIVVIIAIPLAAGTIYYTNRLGYIPEPKFYNAFTRGMYEQVQIVAYIISVGFIVYILNKLLKS